jgi:6,7-dimethyl-8-ribityllumazine synthase
VGAHAWLASRGADSAAPQHGLWTQQQLDELKGEGLSIAVVRARWNKEYVDALADAVVSKLKERRVSEITVHEVPGSFELPFAAKSIIQSVSARRGAGAGRASESDAREFAAQGAKVDAVVCVGVLVKGETMHFEYICEAVSQGIMRASLETGVPIIFGVLTCLSLDQVKARCGLTPHGHNHGADWGLSAIEMAAYNFARKA